MTVLRMDHVGIVVEDLAAATEFFLELGLEPQGEMSIEGELVDRIIGLEDVRTQVTMLQTPDGNGKVELIQFHSPPAQPGDASAPSNALGIRHLTFAVEAVDDVVARLERHGAELVGEVVTYGNAYRLCYLRGPAGVIVELAEPLS
jgi:catechol 2,3-dioxygenase-like lactoylglutathione lyase family enzyme